LRFLRRVGRQLLRHMLAQRLQAISAYVLACCNQLTHLKYVQDPTSPCKRLC
jgi:hypothetical protein